MSAIDPEKLAALRSRVAGLTLAQKERLRVGLEKQGISWGEIEIVPEKVGLVVPHVRPEKLPLTPSQLHVWVMHQLYPELCAYHIAFAWHFEGSLDSEKVRQAVKLLAVRHEGLRTVFRQDDNGKPYQIVLADGGVDFTIAEKADSELVTRAFDLGKGPLARMEFVCLGPQKYNLRIVLHHLIADGWSRGILMRDFSRFYREGEGDSVEDLSTQAYNVFQSDQNWRAGEEAKVELNYWKNHLDGFTRLELPSDRQRPVQASFESSTLTRKLPCHLRNAMFNLGKQSGASLFMVMLAAFKFLLYRQTGERDLALGVPVGGRRDERSRDLLGFFVNTLVMRTQLDLPATATFKDLVRLVRETVLGGLANQFVPLSEVIESCALERTSSQNPLFEVMFQLQSDGYGLQNAASPELGLDGVKVSQEPLSLPETKFDLTWHLFEREDGFLLAVEYRTALFDQKRIERLMGHFENLLECLASDSTKLLVELELLGEEEKSDLINHSKVSILGKPWVTFLEGFCNQVKRCPSALAVRCEGDALSFQELDKRSDRLSFKLREQGVGKGTVIGVALPRRPELLVAILGIMKAGAAYLPIDPDFPRARREYLQEDSGCLFVLESTEESESADDESTWEKPVESDLCYLLYTSGSTGEPKGVEVSHGNLMHYLNWAVRTYPFDGGWGSPVQSSVGFDATITSLLGPLLVGKTVWILPQENVIEPLAELMQSGPGVVKLTPAHLAAVEPFLGTKLPLKLLPKALVIGGEALTEGHVEFWRKYYPQVRLFNEYGPTETVVGCCVHEVNGEVVNGAIPIGFPTAGTSLYVLDQDGLLQAIGVPGELYIAGAGVAKGYRNRPELTSESFLPNPFATCDSDQVIYRTGDRVVRGEDGSLIFLGRLDDQLQLRGYRIEPREVEDALRRQPKVVEAAVVLREGHLIAFVKGGVEADLEFALKEELPAYMVPRLIRVIPEFPLTSNGKVDREALPELIVQKVRETVEPTTEREAILLKVWKVILGKEELGVEDNFFEQGGDSILAMQIIVGARREGLKLTPAMIFEHQTIASLARVAEVQEEELVEVVSGKVLVSTLQRQFLQAGQAELGHFHQGVLVKIAPNFVGEILERALREVVAYHDAFRLSFDENQEQSYREARGDLLFESMELSGIAQIADHQGPVDLREGPLTRAVVLKVGGKNFLWWQAHHFIVDGFSWRILLEDLERAYCQLEKGDEVKLSPKTTSLAIWMEGRESPSEVKEAALTLFDDDSDSRWTWAEMEEREWEFSCGDAPVQESEVLGALVQACGDFFRVEKLPVAVESHGRVGKFDVSRTVGWFTEIKPIEVMLPGTGLVATVKRVKDLLDDPCQVKLKPQMSFNFLGKLTISTDEGSLILGLADNDLPGLNAPGNLRPFPLEVIAWLSGDLLRVRWRWHRSTLNTRIIEQVAERHLELFRSLRLGESEVETPRKKNPGMSKLMDKLKSRNP